MRACMHTGAEMTKNRAVQVFAKARAKPRLGRTPYTVSLPLLSTNPQQAVQATLRAFMSVQ